MLAGRLLEHPVSTAEMDPRHAAEPLFPEEEPAVASAVAKRRLEFTAGRTCARRAMTALGEPPAAIPQGKDRSPLWPPGLVGSITHTGSWCAAAVARAADGVLALGIDVEPAEPIEPKLLRIICLPEEREFLAAQPEGRRGLLAKILFSAKECAYKCQYALSRTFLDFHAMHIRLDEAKGGFSAEFQRDAGPFAAGNELRGRFLVEQGFVMTAMALTSASAAGRQAG